MKYKIIFKQLITELLPIVLRKEIIIEFIHILINPIARLHGKLQQSIEETNRILSYNSQYPNLQRLLNDNFDSQRRIEVKDSGDSIDDLLIYPNAEYKPLLLGQILIHQSSKWGQHPFLVIVPHDILTDFVRDSIEKTVNQYKFLGTKFLIITK